MLHDLIVHSRPFLGQDALDYDLLECSAQIEIFVSKI